MNAVAYVVIAFALVLAVGALVGLVLGYRSIRD
jgi:hypothetical protein